MSTFQGPYDYTHKVVTDWNSTAIGVYYCGVTGADGNLVVHYVGKGTGDGGIRGRLLDHLHQDRWPDVKHFGYIPFATTAKAEAFEATEIKRLRPKYNVQGK